MKDKQENTDFIRVLGNKDVLVLAFGAMIGWSWVLLSGYWVESAGSLGTLIAMAVGGLAIGFVGMTYAELASAMPQVGGEHVYTERALGRNWSFVCTWALLFAYVATCAYEAVALPTAIEYLVPAIKTGTWWQFQGADVDGGFVLVGIAGTVLITIINILGIKTAAAFQKLVVLVIALAALLLITGALSFGSVANAEPWISSPATGILVVLIMVPGLMVGFDVIPQSAEEIDLPYRQIGRVIILSIGLAVLFYSMIAVGVAMALPSESLKSAAIASGDAASHVWGGEWAGSLLVLGGVGGILTSWNAFVIGGSRVLYALAKSGQVPVVFMKLHPKHRTPWVGIVFIGLLSLVAPVAGKTVLIWIVNGASFAVMVAFLFVAISFVVLRRKEPDMERPFRVKHPRLVGYGAIILSLGLLSAYLPWSPSALAWPQEWGMITAWAVIGLIVWLVMGRQDRRS